MDSKREKPARPIVWALADGGFRAGIMIDGHATNLTKGRSEAAALEGLIAALIALQYSTVLLLAEAKSHEHKMDPPDKPLPANGQHTGV